jgi:hypothetical protein
LSIATVALSYITFSSSRHLNNYLGVLFAAFLNCNPRRRRRRGRLFINTPKTRYTFSQNPSQNEKNTLALIFELKKNSKKKFKTKKRKFI